MNKVILIGRLTSEPEIKYSSGENPMEIARYTLAVDRKYNREEQSVDFINCVAFGKTAEFTEKYLHRGTKITITGHFQTGSYTNKDGIKVYTTDVIIEEQEFAESKNSSSSDGEYAGGGSRTEPAASDDGFMNIPDGIDEELPFN